mgnify:CR=1 FL=1|jgi:hypothetical protein|tara:strand:+ start:7676 stop:8419 length:744 start_codon:yes stop_codon:yes gene_type:complete
MAGYRSLSSDKTFETIELLGHRIEERFPKSNLKGVCDSLLEVARASKAKAAWIARPNYPLRVGIGLVIVVGLVTLGFILSLLEFEKSSLGLSELVLVFDAAISDVVFMGAAVFFLGTIESRIKRKRALLALHELRSLAHVVDMHQLTKDPNAILNSVSIITPSSPSREMTPFELNRYLDYCSELLSLTGKIAALYVQESRDSVILTAVTDIENLTNDLNRQIWQKLIILQASYREESGNAGSPKRIV